MWLPRYRDVYKRLSAGYEAIQKKFVLSKQEIKDRKLADMTKRTVPVSYTHLDVYKRQVDGVVARHALHACQLAAHIVPYMLQLLRVVAPRHDVAPP